MDAALAQTKCAQCGQRRRLIGFRLYSYITGAMLLVGAFGGVMFAYTFGSATNADIARHFEEKNNLRAQCVAGNDRACKLYEVDYGRR